VLPQSIGGGNACDTGNWRHRLLSAESYERVCEAKQQGRLPRCDLIFPDIEMRLGIGTVKGKWVNLHLLDAAIADAVRPVLDPR
jgi:hypothetical protein